MNKTAAICEQDSPIPTLQVQCPHTTVPPFFTATQGLVGGCDNLCKLQVAAGRTWDDINILNPAIYVKVVSF